jgi:hypothetical protein
MIRGTELQPSDSADPKDLAYYSALVGAWIETKMERDRTLVTLSAAGIGLLVTILTTAGIASQRWILWLYGGAFLGFVLTLLATLVVFGRNSRLIEQAVQGTSQESPKLRRLDLFSMTCFSFAVGCTIAIGFVAALAAS